MRRRGPAAARAGKASGLGSLRIGASEPTGAIVGRLTATERGEYPAIVLVDGPLGVREYRPFQASCTNIDAELGERKGGRRGFTCSACWHQCDAVPRFCPGCGAEVKGAMER